MADPAMIGPVQTLRHLSDSDLLSRLVGAADAARRLGANGNLRGVVRASRRRGATDDPLALADEILRRQRLQALEQGAALTRPSLAADFLRDCLEDRGREVFGCLFLDTRHRVLAWEPLFAGGRDGARVHPGIVAARALGHGASAIIAAHNHPSGARDPSAADRLITVRLAEALALVEVRLLDHFIIGDGEPVSLAGLGLVPGHAEACATAADTG